MDELISCKALRHSYHGTEVLHGVDFSVSRGEIVGLLGKNGAGKSTSINILMGFMPPDSGECMVMGHPSHAIPPKVRARIGLLHEGFIQFIVLDAAMTPKQAGRAVQRLLEEHFSAEAVRIATYGNVRVAAALLDGLAQEDLEPGVLDPVDPDYPVLTTARAVRTERGRRGAES